MALTRSRRRKLSSLYQQRTSSASEWSLGLALPVKKPRAWLDHGISGICCSVSQARDRASQEDTHPAYTESTIRARLKLLLITLKPLIPCSAAQRLASST